MKCLWITHCDLYFLLNSFNCFTQITKLEFNFCVTFITWEIKETDGFQGPLMRTEEARGYVTATFLKLQLRKSVTPVKRLVMSLCVSFSHFSFVGSGFRHFLKSCVSWSEEVKAVQHFSYVFLTSQSCNTTRRCMLFSIPIFNEQGEILLPIVATTSLLGIASLLLSSADVSYKLQH